MLRIKTVLKPSGMHGIGLFADQYIKEGATTWEYDPRLDISFTFEDFEKLPQQYKNIFLKYGYYDYLLELFIVCTDDQRFINHSSRHYNIISSPDRDVACRDIKPGEELLCNYNHYEPNWFEKRGLIERDFVDLSSLSFEKEEE
jgi:hypothetical protein